MESNSYLAAMAAALLLGQPANAQYTYINPSLGGGYTINTPGSPHPYSYVTPNLGGGYTIMEALNKEWRVDIRPLSREESRPYAGLFLLLDEHYAGPIGGFGF
jgi:hypothetical protein